MYHALIAVAWLFLAGAAPQPAAATGAKDFEVYKRDVEPVFLNKRPGRARCASCHINSRNRFNLEPLAPGATTWDDAASRKNFATVQRLVRAGYPMQSILLVHPLAERAGGDPYHSGGKHWDSQDVPEWQKLKAWVMK